MTNSSRTDLELDIGVLRIGHRTYEIRYMADAGTQRGNGSYAGQMLYNEGVIEIMPGMPPDHERAVVMHEIVHVLLNDVGFGEAPLDVSGVDRLEEWVCIILGHGLAGVLLRNPRLATYLSTSESS